MENVKGTFIYWLISIGLIVGLLFRLCMRNEGISLKGNLIWGIISAVIMGHIGLYMSIGDGLLFAFIASLPFLFLVNVFHQHHLEDLFGSIPSAEIIKHRRL